jgi:hypothetical protein
MRTSLLMAIVALSTIALAACGGIGGYTQPNGLFATAYFYTEAKTGTIVLENGVTPTKEGRACGNEILGIVAQGDTTLETAMKNGGIKKVVYVTHEMKWILGSVYAETCTVARGN